MKCFVFIAKQWGKEKGVFLLLALFFFQGSFLFAQQNLDVIEFNGVVKDSANNRPVSEVHIHVLNSDMGSLTNVNGEFSIKIPVGKSEPVLRFSKVGYLNSEISLSENHPDNLEVILSPRVQKLEKVAIYKSGDSRKLVEQVLEKKGNQKGKLIGFYREKIKRGPNRNVMLAESVLQVDEKKSTMGRLGRIDLYKSRKSTDYKRLDTIAVKLQGGPYNPLYIDVIRYPDILFYKNNLDNFNFEFDEPTTIDNRYIHVISFKENLRDFPWFYGKLYIDAETKSLVRADYHLNVDNKRQARRVLVAQKPRYAKVTPLETGYRADYVLKDGGWYFSYGHFYITLRVNWKGKLFNKRYTVDSELLITDRREKALFPREELTKIKPTVVMSDDVSGFGDPDFWGPNNIIEPDKSIQNTIETIRERIGGE